MKWLDNILQKYVTQEEPQEIVKEDSNQINPEILEKLNNLKEKVNQPAKYNFGNFCNCFPGGLYRQENQPHFRKDSIIAGKIKVIDIMIVNPKFKFNFDEDKYRQITETINDYGSKVSALFSEARENPRVEIQLYQTLLAKQEYQDIRNEMIAPFYNKMLKMGFSEEDLQR
jgi:hypothetical protein